MTPKSKAKHSQKMREIYLATREERLEYQRQYTAVNYEQVLKRDRDRHRLAYEFKSFLKILLD